MKRLILLCDGTLEDASAEKNPALYSNIAKLARALEDLDARAHPPVEQIKLYQGGVGTEEPAASSIVAAGFGRGMRQKVKALYDFLALNWQVGDEIYLFGFSRGAYTVRLLCSLLDVIGILPPQSYLELFPALFEALDAHTGKGDDEDKDAQTHLAKLLQPIEPFRKQQTRALQGRRLVECLGVFDMVGTRGRPAALRISSPYATRYDTFGFDESRLPSCVARTYHALALDEHRIDFLPVIFSTATPSLPTPTGPPQKLLQVWFSGAHADIGGGYAECDLAAIALYWMISSVRDGLAFNEAYLERVTRPVHAPWGQFVPHNSAVPPFNLAKRVDRILPDLANPLSQQFFHPSILSQPNSHLRPDLLAFLQDVQFDATFFVGLSPYEQQQEKYWVAASRGDPPPAPPTHSKSQPSVKMVLRPEPPITPFQSRKREPSPRPSSTLSFTDNEASEGGRRISCDEPATPFVPMPSRNSDRVTAASLRGPPGDLFSPSAHMIDALDARRPGATHRGFFAGVRRRFGEIERIVAGKVERNL